MIESRPDGGRLDEAVLRAIEALGEPERSALLEWVDSLRQESKDSPPGDGEIERERTRLARELHDTIGGDLAASVALFKFYFENQADGGAREDVLHNIQEVLETALGNLRGMLRSLRSREVGPAGLVGELTDMAKAYQRFHGLDVLLKIMGDERDLTPAQQEVVFQVVREALSNVRRHSQSGTCLVTCRFADRPFAVEIQDWGNGAVEMHGDGFGLIGMRERAAGIGGRVQVNANPGRGTTVTLFGPPV